MKAARAESILKGQSAIARKVYEAVPIETAWNVTQIISELGRKKLGVTDKKTIQGVLNSLKGSGLVSESMNGEWRRVKIHQYTAKKVEGDEVQESKKVSNTSDLSPASKLSNVAASLMDIADELQNIAAEVEDETANANDEVQKL